IRAAFHAVKGQISGAEINGSPVIKIPADPSGLAMIDLQYMSMGFMVKSWLFTQRSIQRELDTGKYLVGSHFSFSLCPGLKRFRKQIGFGRSIKMVFHFQGSFGNIL